MSRLKNFMKFTEMLSDAERELGIAHLAELDKQVLYNIQKVTICNNLQEAVNKCDYIIVTCSLNEHTNKMVNKEIIKLANKGVIIINVARGPIVVEDDVIELLDEGYIKSVGFDVFEEEPLSNTSKLLNYEQNIYGSHNGSNTIDAVLKTSKIALSKLKNSIIKN